MSPRIEPMRAGDAEPVLAIYAEGIRTGHATFQTEAPAWADWDRGHHAHCRLVARDAASVIGWAALSPVSSRAVYAGVAEVSVYVAEAGRGQGVGRLLLAALIECSEQHEIWTLQAGIFPENTASLALHAAFGFRVVGRRERIGRLLGAWRDTMLLERRSTITGHD